jgi:HEPN domain-containing protein
MSTEDQEVGQWLFYASEDLAYGKLGRKDLPRAAAWSFQQSAEKSLKALWLEVYREVPRTHDVAFLLSKLSESFEVPGEVRDAILLLAQITPAVRYPSDDQTAVTTGDAQKYAECAERVHKWAIEKHGKLD